MTKKLAMILSLMAAAGFQACRPGRTPVQALDAEEEKLEPSAHMQDSGNAGEDAGAVQPAGAGEEEAVEAALPLDEAKSEEKGKKKNKKEGSGAGKCKYVQCFDLCCDKGQVCAHTHGSGGDSPFPASYKCITPPK